MKLFIAAAILAGFVGAHCLVLSNARQQVAPFIPAALHQFPSQLGDWIAVESTAIETEVQQTIDADQLLSRQYLHGPSGTLAQVFVSYFASQTPLLLGSREPHLPTVCLPAAGWTILRQVTRHSSVQLRISNGRDNREVLFWHQTPSRAFANPLLSRFYGPLDQWRLHRNDLVMARIVLPAGALPQGEELRESMTGSIHTWLSDSRPGGLH